MRFVHSRFTAALLLAFLFLIAAPFASAHARPKVMVPAADSVVASPAAVTVTFSESVEGKFSSLTVTDGQGKKVNKAASMPLPSDAKTLTLTLPPLSAGVYQVQWVSVAADGHRMEGEYKFTVK